MSVILRRDKREEGVNVPLWFWDKLGRYVVSVIITEVGDVQMRIRTPKQRKAISFVAATPDKIVENKEIYRKIAERELRLMGINAKVKG